MMLPKRYMECLKKFNILGYKKRHFFTLKSDIYFQLKGYFYVDDQQFKRLDKLANLHLRKNRMIVAVYKDYCGLRDMIYDIEKISDHYIKHYLNQKETERQI